MSIYALKPRFQTSLRPLTATLARHGVSANQVTLAAGVISIAVGAFVAAQASLHWPFALIPMWMFVRMALNAIDGVLAREFGQKSPLGAYLNELADVVSDCALYLPFALLPPFSDFWITAVTVLAVLIEFASVLGRMVGASRRYEGPLGKSDRAFVFGALGLLAGLGQPLPGWLAWLMPTLVVASLLTIKNRVCAGLAELRRDPAHE